MVKKRRENTTSDWTEMYRLELGIDPSNSNRQQLLTAVSKDMAAAYHGDNTAMRRVAAYSHAQRAFDKQVAAEERAAAQDNGEETDDENDATD